MEQLKEFVASENSEAVLNFTLTYEVSVIDAAVAP